MSPQILILVAIILIALVAMVMELFSIDLIAMGVMVALMLTGVLTIEEGTAGFSNSATLTVLALLILSQGLKNTGAVEKIGDLVVDSAGQSEWKTLLLIMLSSAFLSAFINTTAIVAIYIPIVLKVASAKKMNPSLLLIPLSFAAMIGGGSTMIGTSTNLLINSVVESNGFPTFDIFELTIFGLVLLATLLVFMLTIGKRLLPEAAKKNIEVFDQTVEKKYFITEFVVGEDSGFIGRTPIQRPLDKDIDVEILKVGRNSGLKEPSAELSLEKEDTLIAQTDLKEIIRCNNLGLPVITNYKKGKISKDDSEDGELFEALVIPNSGLVGRKIEDIDFYGLYEAFPLGLRKGKNEKIRKFQTHKIDVGDILLMEGKGNIDNLHDERDLMIIERIAKKEIKKKLPSRQKMVLAAAIILTVVLLAVFNVLPILVSAWAGVVAMFVTGCIQVKQAYENVEWKVVFLLAGLIPLGTALEKTGSDQMLAGWLASAFSGANISITVFVIYLFTTLVTGFLSNQATAILLVPIAIKIATSLQIGPEPLIIAILFGSNTSFLTPVGYQTNTMVYSTGNYHFTDFTKIGGILCFIFALIGAWLIPVFFT